MSQKIYENTMSHLSLVLGQKTSRHVQYLRENKLLDSCRKWWVNEDHILIPLRMRSRPAGCFKIQGKLQKEELNKIYYLIQWTLISLDNIFKRCNTTIFDDHELKEPLLFQYKDMKESLSIAHDLYEKSPAHLFIQCEGSEFNPSILSQNLKGLFLFISDLSDLSKEDQMSLAHFLRTKKSPDAFVVASIKESLKLNPKSVIPSLRECFLHSASDHFQDTQTKQ